MTLQVQIINESSHPLPSYETLGAAGMDLRANLETNVILKPGERSLIPTGLKIQLPVGFEAQIRPRSGLAYRNGISIVNSPGTIDSDYRGEIKILLINHGQEDFVVRDGERIAQMIVARHEQVEWKASQVLDSTERGSGGYGHTGT